MTLTNPVRPALTNALSAVRRSTTGTPRGQDDQPRRSWPPAAVIAALVVLALLLVAAVAPNLLAPYDPLAVDLDATLQPPSWAHPFGTDLSGRDLLSRVIAGTRQSLIIGLGAVALASVLAVLLGIAAGLSGRVAQALANRWIEVMFAFPIVLLGLLLTSVFGPGQVTLILAIGIGIAPGYARIVRGQVLAVRTAPYIEAATALGHPRRRILLQHIAPNALRPMIVTVTLGVGQAIIWASGLAYLGLGVPPPAPEWGALLDAGRTYITVAWWLEIFPGLVIVAVALAFTTVGRHLGARLEGDRR
ncbi:ABC transporter permease [Gordonia McavH-238-E]|uniref:Peptide ABC transporter permease n=1 Tax=Gordonia terrae TaxID=2055 RepID=A0A2I1R7N5_9ACTN|nr:MULTISPECIES: ABC transporter permease [Gordonia]MCG7635662.1 ABC transporter permease [Gordonia sp. McavH-238-E]PKZ65132.1 peptide ABC transporter permease [Gordonia terrae]UPW09334.1 ABC transporter permease [Gordonia terrae]